MKFPSKLPPLDDLLELIARGDSHATIGAQYGVTRDAVSTAIKRARQRGELPPLPPRPERATTPTRRSMNTARAVNDLTITPRSLNVAGAVRRAASGARHYPPPADGPRCGARQALGTRVCDQAPHDLLCVACVGEGERDARGEFWGRG